MKSKISYFTLFLSGLMAACTISPTREGSESDADSLIAEPPLSGEEDPDANDPGEGSVLLENSVARQFDGKGGDEVFTVTLKGENYLDGEIELRIDNDRGERIYTDTFPAIMLAATYDETINTPEKQDQLVIDRMNGFFDQSNFREPAIDGDMPHDDNMVSQEVYNELKAGKTTGFHYLIGKENTKFVAWSDRAGKVVMYFNCC